MPWLQDFRVEMIDEIWRAGLDPDDFEFEEEAPDVRLRFTSISNITVRRVSTDIARTYKAGRFRPFPVTFAMDLDRRAFG